MTDGAGSDGLTEGLVADIVAMTGQAAIDGLPLSAVLDDLRLVLDLAPDAPLPVFALRACALEWGRASTALGSSGPASAALTLDDLEGRVWEAVGRSSDELPAYAVVVRASDAPDAPPSLPRVLDDADLVAAARQVSEGIFDRPHEQVAVLRASPTEPPDRVVTLVPTGSGDEDADLADRVALLQAGLGSSSVTGRASWSVRVVRLSDDPDGVLAGLRSALGRS